MGKLKYPYIWLFCAFAALGACQYGYDGVYFSGIQAMSTFVHHFGTQQFDGTYAISASDLSIMSSMINVGELVGSLGAAPLNDFLGRKGAFLVSAITAIIGTVLQIVTDHDKGIVIGGRVVLGLGVGIFSSTSPLYIGEIAPTEIRGPLLGCWQLTISLAQIIAAVINRGTESLETTASYRVPTAVQLIFPLLVVSLLYWVPESPRWLMRRSKQTRCKAALNLLHKDDKTYNSQADMINIESSLAAEAEQQSQSRWKDLITDPVERRKVIYSAGALIAQQVNGIQWFYYFGTVFSQAIGLDDPFLMSIIVFTIQVVTVFVAVLCANKIPRRPLLLTTTLMMMISIFIVGCLGIPGSEVSKTSGKVIISFVIIEITAFNFAWGPLGWTIASEMAVGRNRNKIYAIAVACFWVTVWVTVFTLPYLYYSANLGPKTGFVYTGLCFITLAYVWFCVGEVTGRSMEEIEGFFRDGVPARQWSRQPKHSGMDSGSVDEVVVEKAKFGGEVKETA
ncbi:general substrate transporter [Lophiostoma macrostomum CBS 122681]|uniref:General substrate transporter n=1 Tax=Lophiostoma macrostomum CBS 122681 TaxID=1314788 RepID=A0A6A6T2E9_9PLEO|nr:general substrate transporter [Lophiostoma macrostomum CBS 122681]